MKYTLLIDGMHCPSCAGNAEKSLKKLKGVQSVKINLLTKKGTIESESELHEKDLKKAVSRAGYKLVEVERE